MRIRTRLLLTFLPLIGVPLLVLGVVGYMGSRLALSSSGTVATEVKTGVDELHQSVADLQEQVQRLQVSSRETLILELNGHLQQILQTYRNLGSSLLAWPAIQSGDLVSDPHLEANLQGLAYQYGLTEISFLDLSGKERLRVGGRFLPPGAKSFLELEEVRNRSPEAGERPWFRTLANSRELETVVHLGPDEDIGGEEPVLSIVFPVRPVNDRLTRDFQELVGVLRLAVPWRHAGRELWPLVQESGIDMAFGNGEQVWGLEADQTLRLTEAPVGLAGRELASGFVAWTQARPGPLAVPQVKPVLDQLQGIADRASAAHSDAESRLGQTGSIIVLVFIVVAVSAVIAFWWFARSLLGPLEELAGAARRVAAGDFDAETKAQGSDEIAELIHDFDTMRDNMKQQLGDLQDSNQALQQATRLKTQFLANMSHEIRTPMNGVIGMTELLAATNLDEEQRELIGTLYRSAEATMNVIEDILDISKIEAGEMTLEQAPFNLRCVAEDTARMVAEKAQQKGLQIYVRVDPLLRCLVIGDKGRIRQVLLNLLSNAVKFTDKGSIVLGIDIVTNEDRSLDLALWVRDTGIGISRDDQKRLFRPFVQLDGSTTREIGGTGLGLAICKQLTSMMGGELTVDSEFGKGSTFGFSLTLQKDKPFAMLRELGCLRVLVVSTDDELADNLEDVFTANGVGFERAQTLESGEALIAGSVGTEEAFDLVWWDKQIFGDDPTCSIARDEDPRRVPYHVLVVPMIDRQGLPEIVVGCYDRVFTTPLRSPVVAECLLELARSSSDRESFDSSSGDRVLGNTATDMRSLAGKVLLVEDNEVNQTVVRRLLEAMDLDVVVVGNGLEALTALDRESFDLILMDCQMPHMDGFHTTQEIRSLEEGSDYHLPIVALTANAMDEDRKRCLDVGMDAYISKPVRAETMYLVLRQFLRPGFRRRSSDTAFRGKRS